MSVSIPRRWLQQPSRIQLDTLRCLNTRPIAVNPPPDSRTRKEGSANVARPAWTKVRSRTENGPVLDRHKPSRSIFRDGTDNGQASGIQNAQPAIPTETLVLSELPTAKRKLNVRRMNLSTELGEMNSIPLRRPGVYQHINPFFTLKAVPSHLISNRNRPPFPSYLLKGSRTGADLGAESPSATFGTVTTIKTVSKRAVERNRVRTRFKQAVRLVITRNGVSSLSGGDAVSSTKEIVIASGPEQNLDLLPGYHYLAMLKPTIYSTPMPELVAGFRKALVACSPKPGGDIHKPKRDGPSGGGGGAGGGAGGGGGGGNGTGRRGDGLHTSRAKPIRGPARIPARGYASLATRRTGRVARSPIRKLVLPAADVEEHELTKDAEAIYTSLDLPTPTGFGPVPTAALAGPRSKGGLIFHLRKAVSRSKEPASTLQSLIAFHRTQRQLQSISSYNILLSYAYRTSNFAAARIILREMDKERIVWDTETRRIMLGGLAQRHLTLMSTERGQGLTRAEMAVKFGEDLVQVLGPKDRWSTLEEVLKIAFLNAVTRWNLERGKAEEERELRGHIVEDVWATAVTHAKARIAQTQQVNVSPAEQETRTQANRRLAKEWADIRFRSRYPHTLIQQLLPARLEFVSPELLVALLRCGVSEGMRPPKRFSIAAEALRTVHRSRTRLNDGLSEVHTLAPQILVALLQTYLYPTPDSHLTAVAHIKQFTKQHPDIPLDSKTLRIALMSLQGARNRELIGKSLVTLFQQRWGLKGTSYDAWKKMAIWSAQQRNKEVGAWGRKEWERWKVDSMDLEEVEGEKEVKQVPALVRSPRGRIVHLGKGERATERRVHAKLVMMPRRRSVRRVTGWQSGGEPAAVNDESAST